MVKLKIWNKYYILQAYIYTINVCGTWQKYSTKTIFTFKNLVANPLLIISALRRFSYDEIKRSQTCGDILAHTSMHVYFSFARFCLEIGLLYSCYGISTVIHRLRPPNMTSGIATERLYFDFIRLNEPSNIHFLSLNVLLQNLTDLQRFFLVNVGVPRGVKDLIPLQWSSLLMAPCKLFPSHHRLIKKKKSASVDETEEQAS